MNIWYKRLTWLLVIYAFQRALFVYFNLASLANISTSDWVIAILDGFRYDISVIATLNLPIASIQYLLQLFLLRQSLSPEIAILKNRIVNRVAGTLFLLVNIPPIAFGIIDSRMYTFTGRRTTLDLLYLAGDAKDQGFSLLMQYWPLTFSGVAVTFAMALHTMQTRHEPRMIRSKRREAVFAVVILFAGLFFIRGGWQTKPLLPTHAYSYQPATLANVVLNSGMTLLRTPTAKIPEPLNDFADMQEIHKILEVPRATPLNSKNLNFVIIIVESLAREFLGCLNNGVGYTPFLDSIAKDAIIFRDSYATGRRSIDAMPAVFAAIPAWRDQPYIKSPFAANYIRPLPRELKKHGYSSAFFHGASTGSMHFDVFAKMAGFDTYYGRENYPKTGENDDDGQWGIFDEPFLKFASSIMTTMQEPFVAGIFTLTSHNPFIIPKKYQGQFPKGTLVIHESIGYADYSLKQFFETASRQPWYKNTIFVITGDHTSISDNPSYNSYPGRFKVPIIFYDPSGRLPKNVEGKTASHIDITPTIFGLLGIEFKKNWLMGGPLFNPHWQGRFIQSENDRWILRNPVSDTLIDASGTTKFFAPKDDHFKSPKSAPDEFDRDNLNKLRASRQYFLNGLLENSWIEG
jgi:phosphoglycerol transferase MdoB-like AlkP superfamily enzyme